jgi:hypothetical protein
MIRYHDLRARREARRQAERVRVDDMATARAAARCALYRRAENDRKLREAA